MTQTTSSQAQFSIVPMREVNSEQILSALNEVLVPARNEEWFRWKHFENPIGPSLGWVALDDRGIIGVRLMMRWCFQVSDKRIQAFRTVDAVTLPRARLRGVFRRLTEHAVDSAAQSVEAQFVFTTPNANSAPGYVSMDWQILSPVRHGFQPVLPARTGRIEENEDVFDLFDHYSSPIDRFVTIRNAETIRWRYSKKSGIAYGTARLQQAESANAIIYRVVVRSGIRLLVIQELLGTRSERAILVHSVAKSQRCPFIFVATGKGAMKLVRGPVIRRGRSVLAVRPLHAISPDPASIDSWALTLGDLERVI
ncbi:GNAT family N-acetyltransferase [bacterium]|nr:GNAT family N-acetyltransferase [bacterium]